MKKLAINPNNKRYYSDEYIKGWEDGVKAQYEATIDAVQVVRCKDCKHRYMDGEVTHYYWCKLHDRPVDDTDFCSWGWGEESEVEE